MQQFSDIAQVVAIFLVAISHHYLLAIILGAYIYGILVESVDNTSFRNYYLFVFMLFGLSSFGQVVHNGVIVPESDSTVVQRRVAELRDSLNNRKFSDDMTKLRMKAEQLGNKTKEVIEEHTPVVKELMQSIADYLKR